MQNFIPATSFSCYVSYVEEELRRVWRYAKTRQRHITLLWGDDISPERAARQAEIDFDHWTYTLVERGVTPEIDIEVLERYYNENVFPNVCTAKKESEYEYTMRDPGGILVKGPDGDFLFQTLEPGVNPFDGLTPERNFWGKWEGEHWTMGQLPRRTRRMQC